MMGKQVNALKLKVSCLFMTVKIMFKWYNNVVATNVAEQKRPFLSPLWET